MTELIKMKIPNVGEDLKQLELSQGATENAHGTTI